ncbi:MAG: hypothetical protein ACTSPI_15265 [Candidatus Heimdallarchaeaceae archaeon]
MAKDEVKINEELLELLEERYKNGEIDEESYNELKSRYTAKLEKALKNFQEAPEIKVSGSQTFTDNELVVSGASKITGGKLLRDIRISGAGKIDGDIECNAIRCSGAVKTTGSITAHGPINCSGSFKTDGFLHTDGDARFSGSCKVAGEVIARGKIHASGSFKAEDNVQSEQGVILSGATDIEGNLISQRDVEIGGKAQILGDIVGENVYIRGRRGALEIKLFRKRELSTVVGSIFAQNEVEIEDVYVNQDVKARLVKLGPNTTINGTVYYVDDLLLTNGAELRNEPVKISEKDLKL